MRNQTEPFAISSHFQELLPILPWLDKLLEKAVTAAQIAYGAAAADDPYRGLQLTQEDVEQSPNCPNTILG